jgi:hypothetical protein
MNNVKRAMSEEREERTPQLQVVRAGNGATRKVRLSPPLPLPVNIYTRKPRPELAVLGWSCRAARLAGRE